MNARYHFEAVRFRALFDFTQRKGILMEQAKTYGEVDRDVDDRAISTAFYASVPLDKLGTILAKEYDAKWIDINDIPNLIFDHKQLSR